LRFYTGSGEGLVIGSAGSVTVNTTLGVTGTTILSRGAGLLQSGSLDVTNMHHSREHPRSHRQLYACCYSWTGMREQNATQFIGYQHQDHLRALSLSRSSGTPQAHGCEQAQLISLGRSRAPRATLGLEVISTTVLSTAVTGSSGA
jgi:hypothetical protein